LLADKIISIPGARPVLMLGAFVIVIALMNFWKVTHPGNLSLAFITVTMLLFTVAIGRSLGYIDTLNVMWPEEDLTVRGYILSYFVKHLIYFFPFVAVVLFARTRKDVTYMVNVLVWTIIALSCYFLYYYIFEVENKGVIELAWEYAGEALGLHKNAASAIYVTLFPLCLARFFVKKDFIGVAVLALSLASIGFLYSRTAYVAAIMAWLMYLVLSQRAKFLPVFLVGAAGILIVLSSSVISSSILERATTSVESGDINEISKGRVDRLWIPLSEEYLNHPEDVVFGKGRYGMLTTAAARQGFILGASHPHNMFVEQILDAGVVGLGCYLLFFFLFLRMTYMSVSSIEDRTLKEYQVGIVVAIVSFLAGGMTQGSLFPELENSFIWAVLGLGVVIARMHHTDESRA
jgi:hypothetical protein